MSTEEDPPLERRASGSSFEPGHPHPTIDALADAINTEHLAATPMTRSEREELGKVLRARTRVARNQIEALRSQRLAEFEAALSLRFQPYDAAWADARARADVVIAQMNATIVAECDQRGVPAAFRPAASVSWSWRGENAIKDRRTELRKAAERHLEALAKEGRARIDAAEAELLTDLVVRGLTSDDARDWLARLPVPERLVPQLLLDATLAVAR